MVADMFHQVNDFEKAKGRKVEAAARSFIELWDAFMHDDCHDTFADCEESFCASVEALRVEVEREFR